MELKSKKEYRNQKFSIGVTVFSFVVMLGFFIYVNNSNASSALEFTHLQNTLKDRSKALRVVHAEASDETRNIGNNSKKEDIY